MRTVANLLSCGLMFLTVASCDDKTTAVSTLDNSRVITSSQSSWILVPLGELGAARSYIEQYGLARGMDLDGWTVKESVEPELRLGMIVLRTEKLEINVTGGKENEGRHRLRAAMFVRASGTDHKAIWGDFRAYVSGRFEWQETSKDKVDR